MNNRKAISLLLGPAIFAFLLIPFGGLEPAIRISIGLLLWMSVWWIFLPVPPAITAFLPVAVNALFNLVDMSSVISCYAGELVFLLAGSDIITMVWKATGVDKRLAARILSFFGTSVRQQIIVWFLLATVMSAFLPNTVVAAVLCSIAFPMLSFAGEGKINQSEAGSLIMMAIVWGANNGGMFTPLGGSMNLITVSYIENLLGHEFMYSDWVVRIFPFGLAVTVITMVFLLFMKCKKKELNGSKEYFRELCISFPPIGKAGKLSIAAFAVATILSFSRQLYQAYIPNLKPGFVFFIFGMLMFFVRDDSKKPVLTWEKVEDDMMWGMFFLFAGGSALGNIINGSGAATALAELISAINYRNEFVFILLIVTLNVVLSDAINNTACAAVTIPIIISLTQGLGFAVLPYLWIATVSYNISYTLPTSIRAIPIGYGLEPRFMFDRGLLISAVQILAVSAIGYLFIQFWPAFSTVTAI